MKEFILLLLLLISFGCNKTSIIEAKSSKPSEQEALFVDTFLYDWCNVFFEGKLPDSLVIEENLSIIDCLRDSSKESYLSFCDRLIQEAEEHNQRLIEAARDFCLKNRGTNTIDTFGNLTYEHYVFTKKQFKKVFNPQREDGWEIFHNLYPHSFGLITVARPGFSKDSTLAVMYIGHQVEYMMGYGRIYVLEKSDNKWIDTKIIIGCEWES